MKLLARELDLPILAVSTTNRDFDAIGNKDRRPGLSTLRGSGSLENYADIVLMLYRDEYYRPETMYLDQAEVIVANSLESGPKHCIGSPARRILMCADHRAVDDGACLRP